jgi:hypothetical protein
MGCSAFVAEPTLTSSCGRGGSARAAARARPVRAVLDPGERGVDLAQDLVGVLAERVVELVVEEVARVIRDVLVARGAREFAVAVVVRRDVLGRALHAVAQGEQLDLASLRAGAHEHPPGPRSVRACGAPGTPTE